ncbi:ATP-dependent DNA helicase srs2 [Sphaceloma murrayae]|uniref:DNA 3'-5' helicase n=1 Tax=Sphaceloma murrayae TaxID=2082308 RepID=A0A2K1R3S8_9PEZI|nr:ATP-dependent DNA helicase srs2 [Sphaceloma murrayae]
MSLLSTLNPAQLSAVTSPANVLQVLAPPGSGKTKTLTARVAHLIARGYHPSNILVCTFTVKAAREMRSRLVTQIGEEAAKRLVLGTFHSVSRRYLVSYGVHIGLERGFGIADAGDQRAMIKRIVKELGVGIEPGKAQGRISAAKARGRSVEMVRREGKKGALEEWVEVYAGYEEGLRVAGLLDYDDLLLRCGQLLRKRPEVVGNVQAVLIDEFQDTNEVQFDLMALFAQKRRTITIVGDPDQSIYGWRNAEIENLNKMKRLYPDTVVIFLEENYRSSAGILRAAQTVIEQDKARPDKRLQATHGYGEVPTLRRLPTAEAEARWVVGEIKRTQGMGGGLLEHNDFAILLRSAQLSRHIETALGNAGVPYRMVGGTKFYDRVEIKVLLDYMRVIDRPEHNDALLRVLNVPARNVGEVTVKKLLDEAMNRSVPIWKLLVDCAQGNARPSTKLSAQAEKGLTDFVNVILSGRKKTDATPAELLEFLLKRLEFEKFLNRKYPEDFDSRWANVDELKAQTADLTSAIEEGDFGDEPLPDVEDIEHATSDIESPLSVFLANIALSSATEQKDASGLPPQCITISTIHAAKGLEWPVVFIPACYDGSIPHSRAEDNDEERRLLYVGMTRAQGILYLSCPVKNSQQQETTLSNFLTQDGVETCFRAAGPELEYHRIGTLAKTLGRSCPAYESVEESRSKMDATWDDTYWPTDGTFPVEESSRWDQGRNAMYPQYSLRREGSGAQNSAFGSRKGFISATKVTLQAVEGFSVATTMQSLHGSFASAKSRMAELELMEEDRKMREMERKVTDGAKSKVTKKVTAAAKHGGDIKSFFGGGGLSRQSSRGEAPSKIEVRKPLEEIPSTCARTRSSAYARAEEDLPEGFTAHRPRYEPTKRPTKYAVSQKESAEVGHGKYVFMSSSPPREERENKRPKVDEGEANHVENASVGFRSASTMHTTSVASLQARSAGKKTLGLRRDFKPWSARTNK